MENHQRAASERFDLTMYVMMFIGQLCWLIYGILRSDVPIIFANIIGCSLTGTILGFKLFLK